MQRSFDGLQGVGISQQLGEIAIGEALEIKSEVYLGQGIGSRIGNRDSNSIFGMLIPYLSLSVVFCRVARCYDSLLAPRGVTGSEKLLLSSSSSVLGGESVATGGILFVLLGFLSIARRSCSVHFSYSSYYTMWLIKV